MPVFILASVAILCVRASSDFSIFRNFYRNCVIIKVHILLIFVIKDLELWFDYYGSDIIIMVL